MVLAQEAVVHRWWSLVRHDGLFVGVASIVARVERLHSRQTEKISDAIRLNLLIKGRVAAQCGR